MAKLQITIHEPVKVFTIDISRAEVLISLVRVALQGRTETHARGILSCIDSDTENLKVLREIKEVAQDDYNYMSRLLGGSLLAEIVNF